jgi:hypothetical protein
VTYLRSTLAQYKQKQSAPPAAKRKLSSNTN